MCFVSRNVILAIFMGVVVGGFVTGRHNIIKRFLIRSIGKSMNRFQRGSGSTTMLAARAAFRQQSCIGAKSAGDLQCSD